MNGSRKLNWFNSLRSQFSPLDSSIKFYNCSDTNCSQVPDDCQRNWTLRRDRRSQKDSISARLIAVWENRLTNEWLEMRVHCMLKLKLLPGNLTFGGSNHRAMEDYFAISHAMNWTVYAPIVETDSKPGSKMKYLTSKWRHRSCGKAREWPASMTGRTRLNRRFAENCCICRWNRRSEFKLIISHDITVTSIKKILFPGNNLRYFRNMILKLRLIRSDIDRALIGTEHIKRWAFPAPGISLRKWYTMVKIVMPLLRVLRR